MSWQFVFVLVAIGISIVGILVSFYQSLTRPGCGSGGCSSSCGKQHATSAEHAETRPGSIPLDVISK